MAGLIRAIVLSLAALLLAACGSPTDLTETFTLDNPELGGTITVRYPRGWSVTQSFGFITFYNRADTSGIALESAQEGVVLGTISPVKLANPERSMTLEEFMERRLGDPAGYSPTSLTLNRRTVLTVSLPSAERTEYWVGIEIGSGTFSELRAIGTPNTIEQTRDVLHAIAAHVDYLEWSGD
jgi:hypothetical protein